MDLGLKDKCALVLASSSGLGKAVAKELAAEGAKVMLFSPFEEQLEEAQEEITAETGNEKCGLLLRRYDQGRGHQSPGQSCL